MIKHKEHLISLTIHSLMISIVHQRNKLNDMVGDIFLLLNNHLHLQMVHFRLNENLHVPNHNWIKQFTRLQSDSFESEIFNIKNDERIFVIWINQEINQAYHHKCHIQ